MDVSVARLRCQFRLLRSSGIRHRGRIAAQKELTGLDFSFRMFVTRTSNQALERTADRRANLLLMTSTLELEALLAIVSGRSAHSS